jgi:hypothetical protein
MGRRSMGERKLVGGRYVGRTRYMGGSLQNKLHGKNFIGIDSWGEVTQERLTREGCEG